MFWVLKKRNQIFPEKKNIKSIMVLKNIKPNINNTNMLNPETKIIVTQADINNKVCPKSGWLTRNITIRNKTKKEYKYLL